MRLICIQSFTSNAAVNQIADRVFSELYGILTFSENMVELSVKYVFVFYIYQNGL